MSVVYGFVLFYCMQAPSFWNQLFLYVLLFLGMGYLDSRSSFGGKSLAYRLQAEFFHLLNNIFTFDILYTECIGHSIFGIH